MPHWYVKTAYNMTGAQITVNIKGFIMKWVTRPNKTLDTGKFCWVKCIQTWYHSCGRIYVVQYLKNTPANSLS